MVRGIYLPADDREELVVRDFTGEEHMGCVDGYIEAVDMPELGVTIYVNAEGLLRRLPFNSRASFLWWYYMPGTHQAMLVGDAVIVGAPDENGDGTDVPKEIVDLLAVDREYAVAIRFGRSSAVSASDGKLSSILLPLTHGDPRCCLSLTRHEDYFSAAAWALVFRERWADVVDAKVVSFPELSRQMQILIDELPPVE